MDAPTFPTLLQNLKQTDGWTRSNQGPLSMITVTVSISMSHPSGNLPLLPPHVRGHTSGSRQQLEYSLIQQDFCPKQL